MSKFLHVTRKFAGAAFLTLGMAIVGTGPVFAQQAAEGAAEAAPAPANPGQIGWLKICNTNPSNNKKVCAINYQLRAQTGQPLAAISIREQEGAKNKQFVVQVPVGMLLQSGLRLQIDKGKQLPLKYDICFPNGCFGRANVDANFISQLKRGGEMTLTVLNQQGQQVPFKFTLAGFTKAYDGPPLDPQAVVSNQQSLQQKLQERAEKAREKLLNE